MKQLVLTMATAIAAFALPVGEASAAIVVYSGSDDGASNAGPFPNSTATQANFLTAAAQLGTTQTITFENQPTGYNANFTAAPGVSVALTGPNFGSGFSGISNTTLGNLYGFNTTPSGSNWLGFPGGTATFSFSSPTNSFGFFLTGVQSLYSALISVNFSDGASQSLTAPINTAGGASYFGFTDAGTSISGITISNISNDAWGIDDVSYTSASKVPEPASLPLLSLGLVGIGLAGRRSRKV